MHYLVTGGCGFIGSNFIRKVLREHPSCTITNLDLLTYAGNRASLADVEADYRERYHFIHGDIAEGATVDAVFKNTDFSAVLNFAAESHVDRSISGPEVFMRANALGTSLLLDRARHARVARFLQVSTDEVYGSLGPDGKFHEGLPLTPSSPYSASKAAADLLVLAHHHTFDQDVVITRCSNNYGPYQYPEKLIPLMILKALRHESLPVYGDGRNVRDWIHVEDHCAGILAALRKGRAGEVYNLGANTEWENIDIVKLILSVLDRPETLITYVTDRLGHDRRYAIDSGKALRELGWQAEQDFAAAIRETIQWYLDHPTWWQPLLK